MGLPLTILLIEVLHPIRNEILPKVCIERADKTRLCLKCIDNLISPRIFLCYLFKCREAISTIIILDTKVIRVNHSRKLIDEGCMSKLLIHISDVTKVINLRLTIDTFFLDT